jgi:hypothetical protein
MYTNFFKIFCRYMLIFSYLWQIKRNNIRVKIKIA